MCHRLARRPFCRPQNDRPSVGGAGRRGDCPPSSQPCVCGSLTGRPNVSVTWEPSICLVRKSGWSESTVRPESANTTNLPADTTLKQLAGAIKARWVCEQAHQQLKEELGLHHFEGRSWTGLHRHCLMSMIAFAFLQSRRLKEAKGEKKNRRPAAPTNPTSDPSGDPRRSRATVPITVPALPETPEN